MYKDRFALIYGLLAAAAVLAVVFTFLIAFTPATPVAHKSDLGPTTDPALIAAAQQEVAREATASGVTVKSQKVVKVLHKAAGVIVVRIKLETVEVGSVQLDVAFKKGIYSLFGVTQSG